MRGIVPVLFGLAIVVVAPAVAVAEDKSVAAKVGESFAVGLQWSANVNWEVSMTAETKKAIEVKTPGPAPGGMPGASKLRDYNFKALQPGEYTFEMQKREVGTNRLLDSVKVTVKVR